MNLASPTMPALALPAGVQPAVAARPLPAKAALQVAYLSASSGGGHDGVARAMNELLRTACGAGVVQSRADIYGAGALKLLPWASKLRYHCDPLWRAFYRATDHAGVVAACAAVLRPLALRRLRAQLPAAPDLLVAVHFGAAQCLQALAASYAVRPRTAVVVTDYEAHRAWFARADHYVVASAMAASRARAAGIAADAITVHPLLPCRRADMGAKAAPVASRVPVEQPAAAAPGRLRVVAAAGADGTSAQRLHDLLRRLDQGPAGSQLQVDVVCGHGRALRGAMLDLSARLCRVELRVHGFVPDLPARFAAADLALLRASPQALTEAVAAGTPVLAFDWHVHEAANAGLLHSLGCGSASRDTETVARALEALVADPGRLSRWTAAARAAAADAPGPAFVRRLFAQLGLPVPVQPSAVAA